LFCFIGKRKRRRKRGVVESCNSHIFLRFDLFATNYQEMPKMGCWKFWILSFFVVESWGYYRVSLIFSNAFRSTFDFLVLFCLVSIVHVGLLMVGHKTRGNQRFFFFYIYIYKKKPNLYEYFYIIKKIWNDTGNKIVTSWEGIR
jgi:hypothetical protein